MKTRDNSVTRLSVGDLRKIVANPSTKVLPDGFVLSILELTLEPTETGTVRKDPPVSLPQAQFRIFSKLLKRGASKLTVHTITKETPQNP